MNALAAIRELVDAGYSVGRLRQGDMVSVELDDRLVWLDVGYTVRLCGDRLDPGDVLFTGIRALWASAESRQEPPKG